MPLTRFCCCCDLRRGCIVFTWLQVILISLIITGMIIPVHIFDSILSHYKPQAEDIAVYSALTMLITEQIIKGVTCIALIWGLVKKQHLFYQAWLFISGIENCILSLLWLCWFFGGFVEPVLFIPLIPTGVVAGLSWYFWFSVYTVYARDMKSTTIEFSENYERISLITSNSTHSLEDNP